MPLPRLFFPSAFMLAAAMALGVAACNAATNGSWPIFRGDASLSGVSAESLPDKPRLLLSFKTEGPVSSSAVVGQDKAFIGSDDGCIYALDFATGQKVWAFKTAAAVEAPPLLAGSNLYCGSTDGFLYAIDARTGKELWRFETGAKIAGSANAFQSAQGLRILVGSYDFKLYCLEAASGKTNWVYPSANFINGAPAIADGKTVFGGCDMILHVLSLAEGTQLRECKVDAPIAASPALLGGRAYFGHYENQMLCVDIESGATAWRFHDKDLPYFSSPAVSADRVVFGGDDKAIHCVNRADGRPAWAFKTRGKIASSPVIARDKVAAGSDDGRLYLLSLGEGKEIWNYDFGQPVKSSPAVANGKLVIGSQDGAVYCFGP